MTPGYQALTDKEKQTLRLLANGHDAKSMARQLGLSVHTVNERLRDARRKLAVSSSREAARHVRDIESATPQILAPKTLVDDVFRAAPCADAVTSPTDQAGAAPSSRRVSLITGAIIMSIALGFIALISLSASEPSLSAPQAPTQPQSAVETETIGAARQWLEIVDTGNWAESWKATGKPFRKLNTQARWAAASEKVRTPLGAVVSRVALSEENVPAPPEGYQIVKFRTTYANQTDATETVSLVRENGSWKVVGCTIT